MRVLFLLLSAGTLFAQSGDATRGKTIYNEKYKCYSCHGYSGQNGPGAKLVPMKMTQTAFIAFVRVPREPRPGSSPAGQQDRMPAYSARVMPDQELADVYAYLKTLPVGPTRSRDIPLLNEISAENSR